jgi:TPR repeat protein
MLKRAIAALAAALLLAGPALAYEPLPPEAARALEACDATVELRPEPSRMGMFHGILYSRAESSGYRYSRGIAVLAGIDDYRSQGTGLVDLPGVETDIEEMTSLLTADAGEGLGYDAVIVLRNKQVTAENLNCVVEAVGLMSSAGIAGNDRVLFYWSGHGVDRIEGGGTNGYLPYFGVKESANHRLHSLHMNDMPDWMASYFAGFRQAMILIDSCVSGYSTGKKSGGGEKGAWPIELGPSHEDNWERLQHLAAPFKLIVTAASKAEETYENHLGGHFTQSVIKMLSGSGDIAWRADRLHGTLIESMNGMWDEDNRQRVLKKQARRPGTAPTPQLEPYAGIAHESFIVPAGATYVESFVSGWEALQREAEVQQSAGAGLAASESGATAPAGGDSSFADHCEKGGDRTLLRERTERQLTGGEYVCSDALARDPDNPRLLLTRGGYNEELGKRELHTSPAKSAEFFAGSLADYVAAGDHGVNDGYLRAASLHIDGWLSSDRVASDAEALKLVERAYDRDDTHGWTLNYKGWMLLNGRGTAPDATGAAALYRRAVERGYPYALVNLGRMAESGRLTAADPEAAMRLFREAGDKGQPAGYLEAARVLTSGKLPGPVEEHRAQALELIDAVLERQPRHDWGLNFKGWMLQNGYGLDKDPAAAAALYEQSRALGYASASYNLGWLYASRELGEPDYARARDLYVEAGQRGHVGAYVEAANLYLGGRLSEGGASADAEALRLVTLALARDPKHGRALYFRGWMAQRGRGLAVDLDAAIADYEKAREAGHAPAMRELALILLYEKGEEPDLAVARDLFGEACELRNAASCVDHAEMLVIIDNNAEALAANARALEFLDRAIEMSPSLISAYESKARMLGVGLTTGTPDLPAAISVLMEGTRQGGSRLWWQILDLLDVYVSEADSDVPDLSLDHRLKETFAAWDAAIAAGDNDARLAMASAHIEHLLPLGPVQLSQIVPELLFPLLEKETQNWQADRAATMLVTFYLSDVFGQHADAEVAEALRRLATNDTMPAHRILGHVVEGSPQLSGAAFKAAGLLPPWEHFARCGALGDGVCYWEAASSLAARGSERGQVVDLDTEERSTGDDRGLYARPAGEPAKAAIRRYLELGAERKNTDSILMLASMDMDSADRQFKQIEELDADFDITVGRSIRGVLSGDPEGVGFDDAFRAAAGLVAQCSYGSDESRLFPQIAVANIWPPYECGWSERFAHWVVGAATTSGNVNLRSSPVVHPGTRIAELAAGTRVVFVGDPGRPDLMFKHEGSTQWLQVRTEAGQFGWVSAGLLKLADVPELIFPDPVDAVTAEGGHARNP